MDYEWKFFICNSEGVFGHTLYIIYTRENFLKNCFCRWYFFWKSPFPVSFSVFQICYMTVFAMRTDLLLLLSWYKRRSNKKKKSRLTSPGLLRKGRSGAEKWTRSVALRSDSIFQSRPSIPTLTPLRLGQSFFLRQYASLLAFSFLMLFYDLLSLVWNLLKYIALIILSSRTEFSILRLSIYILNLSLYILKLSFYILSLSIELLWWRE